MNKLKQRKRLTLLGIVFMVTLLAGAAFAFLPGMLDIIGRVGIREGEYVRWILAATQGETSRDISDVVATDPLAPGVDRIGFTHDIHPAVRAVHGDETISAIDDGVALSHARILDADNVPGVRGRQQQRIEWSVVFAGEGTATLYVQAMNYNDFLDAEITSARIVELSDFGPVAALSAAGGNPFFPDTGTGSASLPGWHGLNVSAVNLNDVFTIAGTFGDLVGELEANNFGTWDNPDSSTGVETVTIAWDGDMPFDLAGDAATLYVWTQTTAAGAVTGGSWIPFAGGITEPGHFDVDPDGGLLMLMRYTDAGGDVVEITFDALEPWIGTFVLEFEYALAN